MDIFDKRILRNLAQDSKQTLKEIGKKVGIFSASSVSKRIASLEKENYIRGYTADVDYGKLDYNFLTVTFVRAKYHEGYSSEIGKKLSEIRGVVSVYFLLGEIDFVLLTMSRDKEEYSEILNQISSIEGVERSDSRTVLEVHKDYSLGGLSF